MSNRDSGINTNEVLELSRGREEACTPGKEQGAGPVMPLLATAIQTKQEWEKARWALGTQDALDGGEVTHHTG